MITNERGIMTKEIKSPVNKELNNHKVEGEAIPPKPIGKLNNEEPKVYIDDEGEKIFGELTEAETEKFKEVLNNFLDKSTQMHNRTVKAMLDDIDNGYLGKGSKAFIETLKLKDTFSVLLKKIRENESKILTDFINGEQSIDASVKLAFRYRGQTYIEILKNYLSDDELLAEEDAKEGLSKVDIIADYFANELHAEILASIKIQKPVKDILDIINSFLRDNDFNFIITEAQLLKPFTPTYNNKKNNNDLLISKPDIYLQTMTKTSKTLFDGEQKDNAFKVNVSSDKNKKKNINNIVYVNLTSPNIDIPVKLGLMEQRIHNAVISFYDQVKANNNYVFTLNEIACFVKFGNQNHKVSTSFKTEIEDYLDQLSVIKVKVDYTEHLEMNNSIPKGDKATVENYLLPIKKLTYTQKDGTTFFAYKFIDEPPLYEYGQKVNQINRIPAKVLDTPNSKTLEMICIEEALTERIGHIKNPNNHLKNKNIIVIENLLKKAGIDYTDRAKRKRHLDKIKKSLDYWEDINYISSYKINKKSGSYYSFTIQV